MILKWGSDHVDYVPSKERDSKLKGVVSNIAADLFDNLRVDKVLPCVMGIWKKFVRNTWLILGSGWEVSRWPVWQCEELKRRNF